MAVLKGREYFELMERTAARVDKWPWWKKGESATAERGSEMNQKILSTIVDIQEILFCVEEENNLIRDVMRTSADVKAVARHCAMLRYYVSRLSPLLETFETEAFASVNRGKSDEAVHKV